jgi:hypothetical protein
MIVWPLMPGLVWPVPVVVPGIGPQHRPQMTLAVNQHPLGALGPHGLYPPFRIAIRPGHPRRSLHLYRSKTHRVPPDVQVGWLGYAAL